MGKRMFMSLTEDEYLRFETSREELGMTRSLYLKYLISGQREIRPPAIMQRELIEKLAVVDRELKIIVMKDSLDTNDRIYIMEQLKEIKSLLYANPLLDNLSRSE